MIISDSNISWENNLASTNNLLPCLVGSVAGSNVPGNPGFCSNNSVFWGGPADDSSRFHSSPVLMTATSYHSDISRVSSTESPPFTESTSVSPPFIDFLGVGATCHDPLDWWSIEMQRMQRDESTKSDCRKEKQLFFWSHEERERERDS